MNSFEVSTFISDLTVIFIITLVKHDIVIEDIIENVYSLGSSVEKSFLVSEYGLTRFSGMLTRYRRVLPCDFERITF